MLRRLSFLLPICGFLHALPSNHAQTRELTLLGDGSVLQSSFTSGAISPERLELMARQRQPLFIFIPGILGSRLTKDGAVLWGKSSLLPAQPDLTYQQNDKVECEILEDYKLSVFSKDVYAQSLGQIASLNIGSTKHFLSFCYDWRMDLRKSAAELDNRLKSSWLDDIADRDIVFVAHSMGGLVLRYWYWNYYVPEMAKFNFKIKNVLFLGTPHQGSISALVNIIQGYSTSHELGWLQKQVEQTLVFSHLNASGHTFPSVYQLLPISGQSIRYRKEPGTTEHLALFDIAVWRHFGWLDRFVSSDDQDAVYARAEQLLGDGLTFNEELAKLGRLPNEQTVYFLSESHPTPEYILMTPQPSGGYETSVKLINDGDGRVRKNSAADWSATTLPSTIHTIDEAHGELPESKAFISLVDRIRQLAIEKARIEIAELVLSDVDVRKEFTDNGILIEVPLGEGEEESETRPIRRANRLILEEIQRQDNINIDLGLIAWQAQEHAADGAQKAQLLAIAADVTELPNVAHYAFRDLAALLVFEGDDWPAAKEYAERMIATLPVQGSTITVAHALATGLRVRGAIERALGDYTASLESNEAAATVEMAHQLERDAAGVEG